MTALGLVICDPARFTAADTMLDARPLLPALRSRGVEAEAVDWADPEVDWARFDLVVLRSPWDYSLHPAEFDAWLDRAGTLTRILNDPALVRWNMDKRYLAQLEQAGVPGVPTSFHQTEESLTAALTAASDGPGTDIAPGAARSPGAGRTASLPSTASSASTATTASAARAPGTTHDPDSTPVPGPVTGQSPAQDHVVLKPTVGAGARLAGLLRPDDPAALALGRDILAEGGTVMLQPEVPELSAGREKALYLLDGHFTHAIAKGALLARGGGLRGGTYRESPQRVEATAAERAFAERVLAATAEVTGLEMPLYARIDLVDTAAHGLVLLEAELFEPLFNLHLAPEVAGEFADAILGRVA